MEELFTSLLMRYDEDKVQTLPVASIVFATDKNSPPQGINIPVKPLLRKS